MKTSRRRLLDATLVLGGIVILFILLQAPPITTPKLPVDKIHQPILSTALKQGKKSAEKSCQACHNPDQIPLATNHPAGGRCLFCHRLSQNQPVDDDGLAYSLSKEFVRANSNVPFILLTGHTDSKGKD